MIILFSSDYYVELGTHANLEIKFHIQCKNLTIIFSHSFPFSYPTCWFCHSFYTYLYMSKLYNVLLLLLHYPLKQLKLWKKSRNYHYAYHFYYTVCLGRSQFPPDIIFFCLNNFLEHFFKHMPDGNKFSQLFFAWKKCLFYIYIFKRYFCWVSKSCVVRFFCHYFEIV